MPLLLTARLGHCYLLSSCSLFSCYPKLSCPLVGTSEPIILELTVMDLEFLLLFLATCHPSSFDNYSLSFFFVLDALKFFHQNLLYSLLFTHSLGLYRTFIYKHCVHICTSALLWNSLTYPFYHFTCKWIRTWRPKWWLSIPRASFGQALKRNMGHPTFLASCPTLRSIRSLKIYPIYYIFELHSGGFSLPGTFKLQKLCLTPWDLCLICLRR